MIGPPAPPPPTASAFPAATDGPAPPAVPFEPDLNSFGVAVGVAVVALLAAGALGKLLGPRTEWSTALAFFCVAPLVGGLLWIGTLLAIGRLLKWAGADMLGNQLWRLCLFPVLHAGPDTRRRRVLGYLTWWALCFAVAALLRLIFIPG